MGYRINTKDRADGITLTAWLISRMGPDPDV